MPASDDDGERSSGASAPARGSSGTRRAERARAARTPARRSAGRARRRRPLSARVAVDDHARPRAPSADTGSRSRPNGSAPVAQVLRGDDHDVDVARDTRGAESRRRARGRSRRSRLRDGARAIARCRRRAPRRPAPTRASSSGSSPLRSRSARMCDAVADDDDAVLGDDAAVAAAQNRRPLAGGDQQPRDERDDRRLAAPAHRDVADADDGDGAVFHRSGPFGVRASAASSDADRPDLWHRWPILWKTRPSPYPKGRTTPRVPGGGRSSAMASSVRGFAPRLASTSARAAAPRRARSTGSPISRTTAAGERRGVRHLHGRLVLQERGRRSPRSSACADRTRSACHARPARGCCARRASTRLPPTKTTVAT